MAVLNLIEQPAGNPPRSALSAGCAPLLSTAQACFWGGWGRVPSGVVVGPESGKFVMQRPVTTWRGW